MNVDATPVNKRPNIVLILADDLRHDAVAALGHPDVQTPNLDQLAARGTACRQAHIRGSTVPAVCMPSRAMLHTGRDLFGLEDHGATIPSSHPLLGELLRGEGYRTFAVGKWHNGPESFARSFGEGAEIFFGGMADHWNVPVSHFDPSGQYNRFAPECVDYWHGVRLRKNRCDHVSPGIHSTDLFAGAACDFLAGTAGKEDPFFLSVAFMAPHDPRVAPESYHALYDPAQLTLPPNLWGSHPFDNGDLFTRDEHLAPIPRTEAVVREHLRDYYAMVTHLDAGIGRILEALEASGRQEQTIVVVAADHGLALGEHGLMGKQNLYNHSIRVPLLIAGPGIPVKRHCQELCYLHDLMPTLLELTGIPIPASVQSRSLLPTLLHGVAHRERLCFNYGSWQRGVRRGARKAIHYNVNGVCTEQWFDLDTDPWEGSPFPARPDAWGTAEEWPLAESPDAG